MAIPKIYYDGTKDEWVVVHNETESGAICFGDCTSSNGNCTGSLPCGDTGVFGGGWDGKTFSTIDYITISTPGNAQNFGNLTVARYSLAATSNGTNDRGVFGGGLYYNGSYYYYNTIDYITISSPGNAQDFGNLSVARNSLAATSNGTNDRGVFGGGDKYKGSLSCTNVIDYITISTPGNAQDFGDLTQCVRSGCATSNGTNDRGVFGETYLNGGGSNNESKRISYITISTPGNAKIFGNLTVAREKPDATSNGTNDRGVFGGGFYHSGSVNTIDYITISTPGNAQDFGDLTIGRYSPAATSNGTNNRGVIGGGSDSHSTFYNTIDYITISSPGNAQNFGNLTGSRGLLAATSNA